MAAQLAPVADNGHLSRPEVVRPKPPRMPKEEPKPSLRKMMEEAERGERCSYCYDLSSDIAPCMFCSPITGRQRQVRHRASSSSGPHGRPSGEPARRGARPPEPADGGRASGAATSDQADGAGRESGKGLEPPPSPSDEEGRCQLCRSEVRRVRWALWLACQECHVIACMECLKVDASQEDGPIEILCPECKQARRQERLTEELEDLFDDLGKALFDEATVVELSNIAGCSQAEAKALLTQHEGNLEMAVRSYIASENQHSVGVEERRKTAEERGASRSAQRDARQA